SAASSRASGRTRTPARARAEGLRPRAGREHVRVGRAPRRADPAPRGRRTAASPELLSLEEPGEAREGAPGPGLDGAEGDGEVLGDLALRHLAPSPAALPGRDGRATTRTRSRRARAARARRKGCPAPRPQARCACASGR